MRTDLKRPKMQATCFKCGYYNKSLGRGKKYKCFVRNSCPIAYDEWKERERMPSRLFRKDRKRKKVREVLEKRIPNFSLYLERDQDRMIEEIIDALR